MRMKNYVMITDIVMFLPCVCTLNILNISIWQSSYSMRFSSYCLLYSSLHKCSIDKKFAQIFVLVQFIKYGNQNITLKIQHSGLLYIIYKCAQNILRMKHYVMNTDFVMLVPLVCAINIFNISIRQSSYSMRFSSYCLLYSSIHNCSIDKKL